jgi:hypothetical protein
MSRTFLDEMLLFLVMGGLQINFCSSWGYVWMQHDEGRKKGAHDWEQKLEKKPLLLGVVKGLRSSNFLPICGG